MDVRENLDHHQCTLAKEIQRYESPHQTHAFENTLFPSFTQSADPNDNTFSPGVVKALAHAGIHYVYDAKHKFPVL